MVPGLGLEVVMGLIWPISLAPYSTEGKPFSFFLYPPLPHRTVM